TGSGEGLMATTNSPAAEHKPVGAQRAAERRAAAPLKANSPQNNSLAASVKDAALAALLVAVLGFFFLALRTEIAPGGLAVSTRWGLWFTSIAVVFGG